MNNRKGNIYTCLSWERDKLEIAKNLVASFPEIRPSPSTIQKEKKGIKNELHQNANGVEEW